MYSIKDNQEIVGGDRSHISKMILGGFYMFKRKLAIVFVVVSLALTFTACGSNERNSDEVQSGQEQNDTNNENNNNNTGMVHLDSAEAVDAFINEMYAAVSEELLPMGIENNEQDLADLDTVKYNSGISDYSQIQSITVSESMMRSTAYSLVYVRTTDEADADAIRQEMMDNIDPRKWICVGAQKEVAIKLGNDVLFIMGDQDTVKALYDEAVRIATDKGMSVSEAIEKDNPF